ncbi:MAG: TatD family hydrolase [Holosporales bacterium]|jgi:TatD DNase family protein|nr:TatD family hydrolase [Holosporales bacterium]
MLVDSHCHLNYPKLYNNLLEKLARARARGVELFLTVGTTLEETSQLAAISVQHKDVYYTVGVHPDNVTAFKEHNIKEFITDLRHHVCGEKVVGIGEIGLDYHSPSYDKELQHTCFIAQLEVAKDLNFPVCIHTREADEDIISVLSSFKGIRGVIHCFSGDRAFARKVLDLGFFISFTGILTFPKAAGLREVATFIPNDRILVETDAPFLAPVPHRGKPNEPAFVSFTAQKLAEIKGISLPTIEHLTTENFFSLFTCVPKEAYEQH